MERRMCPVLDSKDIARFTSSAVAGRDAMMIGESVAFSHERKLGGAPSLRHAVFSLCKRFLHLTKNSDGFGMRTCWVMKDFVGLILHLNESLKVLLIPCIDCVVPLVSFFEFSHKIPHAEPYPRWQNQGYESSTSYLFKKELCCFNLSHKL